MFDEWWKKHPKITHWWETGTQNSSNVCPDWFANKVGYSMSYSLLDMYSSTNKSIGLTTELGVILKAGYAMEKLNAGVLLANTWCLAGNFAGFSDAAFQERHNGMHVGTAMSEWYETKEDGVYHFLEGVNEWWKS
jgi:hypothetical protein